MEKIKEQLIKNSFWSVLLTFISRAGALIFTVVLVRIFSPEKFGIYTLALSIAMIFLSFTDLGVEQTMMKYVSSEINKNKKKTAAYFKFLLKLKKNKRGLNLISYYI